MAELDFSALDDDQLLGLARAVLEEGVRRNAALSMAMEGAMLDAAERARVARGAGDLEAAAIRAAERERIAQQPAGRRRAAHAAEVGDTRLQDARRRASEAAEAAKTRQRREMEWLQRAGDLLQRRPADISLLYADTRRGRRVMINLGCDRYAPDHLADWTVGAGTVSTVRAAVARKPEIVALCAEVSQLAAAGSILCGRDYPWESTT